VRADCNANLKGVTIVSMVWFIIIIIIMAVVCDAK
jgi:hypothetical protein